MHYDKTEKYWLLPGDAGVPDGDEQGTFIMAGWPAPPDAYRVTPGERLRLTAH